MITRLENYSIYIKSHYYYTDSEEYFLLLAPYSLDFSINSLCGDYEYCCTKEFFEQAKVGDVYSTLLLDSNNRIYSGNLFTGDLDSLLII